MRLSTNPADRGYRTYRALPAKVAPLVSLDGVELQDVVTADSVLGYVVRGRRDDAGSLLLNARCTAVQLEQLRGRVEIVLKRVV
jgi:hypothetical protein